ncbi:MAG TPA: PfkB family carbohydrate kinase [Candidatus Eisenbacteria bacterium]|jgi:sugar/nucleoside kinase (ribokinase family)|nr:PfkB family carbohydrate kinase [Candidatus Eisenbacteria bacterium]
MPIAVVGSLGLDTIQTPAGRVEEVLGGSAAYFALAARHFEPVHVVAVVGTDFPLEARTMLTHPDVDLSGLEVREGRTFRWEGVYSEDMNTRKTIRTELNVFESFRPELPAAVRRSRDVFLANIDPVLQREVLEQLPHPRLVLADTMNYWIANKREELLTTLKLVRILLINEEEARQLTGEPVTHKAARAILSLGPETVVVKMGEHGAFLLSRDEYFTCPAFPLESVVDPTGAGDTFAGGFMGSLSRMGRTTETNLRRAVVYGCVLASFAVEEFGVKALLRVDRDEVVRRAEAISAMSRVNLDNTARILR